MTNDQNVRVIHFTKEGRRPKRKRRVHRKASQVNPINEWKNELYNIDIVFLS